MKVIFLDNDGVLNGYGLGTEIFIKVMRTQILRPFWKMLRKHWNLFDIHKKYVRRLSKIVKETGAIIVSSSSWRGRWMIAGFPEDDCDDFHSFCKLFKKYHLQVYDVTPNVDTYRRADEIQSWLDEHKHRYIESFVILDDECIDLFKVFPNNVVCTSKTGKYKMIQGFWYEGTGLKRKNVKEAIKILNTKRCNDDSTN